MALKRSRATFEADLQAQQSPYVFYGTPLPPQDPDVRDDGSYVPVWKQEVLDDQGRKRLHGAFTGGFSAGYFNTVGSKEGWTPSTFVSSRNNRNKDAKTQKRTAEDFMDEEDLADAEEARKVQTTGEFAGIGSTPQENASGNAVMDIFKVEGETMGVKLLKKMGWREGQGIGPKVRRKARLDESTNAVGEETEDHLFAPEDSQMIAFARKSDHKGLGFEGEGKLGTDRTTSRAIDDQPANELLSKSSKRPIKKNTSTPRTSFGVGILNDTGSDDEDPYSIGPQISYKRTLGPEKKQKHKFLSTNNTTNPNPLLKSNPQFISRKKPSKNPASLRKCHDGRLPLPGFVLSSLDEALSSILSTGEKYPPPEVPPGWRSSKTPRSQSNAEPTSSSYQSTADTARSSNLSPKTRARLLGEAQLPGKSVFDYLSPTARDKIVSASQNPNLPPARNEAAALTPSSTNPHSSSSSPIPHLDPSTAQAALARLFSGWTPYADSPAKQSRYRSFLEYSAATDPSKPRDHETLPPPERAPQSSNADHAKELQEFAHAAQIFKPVTGLMASRFTSSRNAPPTSSTPAAEQDSKAQDSAAPPGTDSLLIRPSSINKPTDPALEAAKLGMFGPLTRSTHSFYPTRLLCKRFNVPPPTHADPGAVPGEGGASSEDRRKTGFSDVIPGKKLDLVGRKQMEELRIGAFGGGRGFVSGGYEGVGPEAGSVDTAAKQAGEEEKQSFEREKREVEIDPERNEALEKERPGDDLFKAIFGSDDEED